VSSDGGSFAHLGFHIGTDWRVDCHTYDNRAPILTVDTGSCSISFYLAGSGTDKAAVEFTQTLARAAQAFAKEVERLHAEQLADADDGDTKADAETAA
jgi:hypothetical protein